MTIHIVAIPIWEKTQEEVKQLLDSEDVAAILRIFGKLQNCEEASAIAFAMDISSAGLPHSDLSFVIGLFQKQKKGDTRPTKKREFGGPVFMPE